MRHRFKFVLTGVLVLLTSTVGSPEPLAQGQSKTVTPADYLRWRTELRNWGRWGPNDQRGASNLITAAKVQNAARLVKAGLVISLAPLVPQEVAADVGENAVFHLGQDLFDPLADFQ